MPCFLKHSLVSEKFSTTDALVYSTEKTRCDKNEKKITAAAVLDLSKAFDSINNELISFPFLDFRYQLKS